MHGLETLIQLNERVAHNRATNAIRDMALKSRAAKAKKPEFKPPRCVSYGCGKLTWLPKGKSIQTGNGFVTAVKDAWVCEECAGAYGDIPEPPKSYLDSVASDAAK